MGRRELLKALFVGLGALFGAGPISARAVEKIAPRRAEPAANLARVRAMPGYRIEVVDGAMSLERWEELRAAGEGYPVIVGGAEALNAITAQMGEPTLEDPAAILARASALSWPQAIIDTRRGEGDPYADLYASENIEEEYNDEVGEWPAAAAPDPGLTTNADILTGQSYNPCFILVTPAQHGWEVPAYLGWGGWNENPEPALHVAALKSWHERFGAELVGMSEDVLNLRIARAPQSRAAALDLAREQYAYCADIVDQGLGTLAALAASHLQSRWWYFWWD